MITGREEHTCRQGRISNSSLSQRLDRIFVKFCIWLQIHVYQIFLQILGKSIGDFYSKTISKVICETLSMNISYDVKEELLPLTLHSNVAQDNQQFFYQIGSSS